MMLEYHPSKELALEQIFMQTLLKIQFLQPRNKEQEQEVLNWISAVLGEPLPGGAYEDVLQNGVVLCKLINKLSPGSVKKIQEKGSNFQLMENVQRSHTFSIIHSISL